MYWEAGQEISFVAFGIINSQIYLLSNKKSSKVQKILRGEIEGFYLIKAEMGREDLSYF